MGRPFTGDVYHTVRATLEHMAKDAPACRHDRCFVVDVDPSTAFANVACCRCSKEFRVTEEDVEDGKIEIVRK